MIFDKAYFSGPVANVRIKMVVISQKVLTHGRNQEKIHQQVTNSATAKA
jgi:hypothetical protein